MQPSLPTYTPRRPAESLSLSLRGLNGHLLRWGNPGSVTIERPLLVLLHGWMDVAASFQFVVDALAVERCVVALDWRGYGGSDGGQVDSYWFPDYLGDLDALLRADALGLGADTAIDLVGHSMGGNVAMLYAGVRPARVRRLINLEGFGLPASSPEQAPRRYAQWLDEIAQPVALRSFANIDGVAQQLRKNNPRLSADKAAWLAPQWAQLRADGRWHVQGDPAHKRVNPMLYRKDEVLAVWQQIAAPTLWVEGAQTDLEKWWGDRYPRADFDARLAMVRDLRRERLDDCGHMVHHDQPERLAALLDAFLA